MVSYRSYRSDKNMGLVLTLLFFLSGGSLASPPTLLKDLEDVTGGSGPIELAFAEAGGLVYFVAAPTGPPTYPTFLYRSDGTPTGTYPVRRIDGGLVALDSLVIAVGPEGIMRSDGSLPGTYVLRGSYLASPLARLGGYVYFDGGIGSPELWRTDGSVAGTSRVLTVPLPTGRIERMVANSDRLFFHLEFGKQLFVSDGTSQGTLLLGSFQIDDLVAAEGRAFFRVGLDLWSTDGTVAGTVLLKTFPMGTSSFDMVALGNRILFQGRREDAGHEPWVSDGTVAGTFMLLDVVPGASSSSPRRFRVLGATAFFLAAGGIWRSDGTPLGTEVMPWGLDATALTSSRTRLLFATGAQTQRLWISDGTPAGTILLREDSASANSLGGGAEIGDRVLFRYSDGRHGAEPWWTDGSPAGTQLLVDVNRSTLGLGPGPIVAGIGRAYFQYAGGFWVTDGTEAGTREIRKDGAILSGGVGAPRRIGLVDDVAFYCGNALWRTDGSDAGTTRLAPLGQACEWVGRSGQGMLFGLFDTQQLHSLWRSDGSPGKPELVTNLGHGLWSSGGTALGQGTLFNYAASSASTQLWFSDGTGAGTRPLAEVVPGPGVVTDGDGQWFEAVVAGPIAFFRGGTQSSGPELWTTDGTVAGTRRVVDVPLRVEAFAGQIGGVVYFIGRGTLQEPAALWRSDGTPEGTRAVPGFDVGSDWPAFPPVVSAGRVFLFANQRLWSTDGSDSGAQALTGTMLPRKLWAVAGGVAFSAPAPPSVATGPWFSDGAPSGTRSLGAIEPVSPSPLGPRDQLNFARLGSSLLFSADERLHGRDLWKADLDDVGRLFYTVVPCRVFDTRIPEDQPQILAGTSRNVQVTGRCGVPADATAVAVNVTVVGPTAVGYLVAGPADRSSPGARSVSFRPGQTRASSTVLGFDPISRGRLNIALDGSGYADVVLDVSGYFR